MLLVISACLILLLPGCAKQEIKQTIKPFENIPINSAESIEFSNYTIRSENKELGRIKIVTKKQDMEKIVTYIKTLSCTKSTREIKDGDYSIRLSDGKGDFIYSLQVSKNQIYINGDDTNPITSLYDYKDAKIISELMKVYNEMNYKEVFIMRK